jgi:DNA-binding beta-propeller fold protein YncE
MAYDPLKHYMYVANWLGSNVIVMNGTKRVASVNVGTRPESTRFDPVNGYMYVANSVSNNMSLIVNGK